MITPTIYCRWEDETVRERIGPLPTCIVAKKIRLLTLFHLWLAGG